MVVSGCDARSSECGTRDMVRRECDGPPRRTSRVRDQRGEVVRDSLDRAGQHFGNAGFLGQFRRRENGLEQLCGTVGSAASPVWELDKHLPLAKTRAFLRNRLDTRDFRILQGDARENSVTRTVARVVRATQVRRDARDAEGDKRDGAPRATSMMARPSAASAMRASARATRARPRATSVMVVSRMGQEGTPSGRVRTWSGGHPSVSGGCSRSWL